jgi:hypothetical protein
MSKGIRRPVMKSPFEAKRVIVAACAAIAMVLGAMSAGATVSSSHEPPSKAEVSSIVNADPPKRSNPSSVSTGLTKKHTIEGRDFFQQPDTTLYGASADQNKIIRNSVAAVFSAANPVLFLTQIVQVQQPSLTQTVVSPRADEAVPAANTTPASETPKKDEAPKQDPEIPVEAPTPTTPTPNPDPNPIIEPLSIMSVPNTTPVNE